MKYFRYKNINKTQSVANKELYKLMTDEQKRAFKKQRMWSRISSTVFLSIVFLLLGASFFAFSLIPMPTWWLWKVLVQLGIVLMGFVALLCSFLVAGIATIPLEKRTNCFTPPPIPKTIYPKACQHLREYYGLCQPYVLTKCFDCTNKKFKNKDVCVFVAKGKLRITVDLVHGFLHGWKDAGCYVFDKKEISLAKIQTDKGLMLQLKAKDTVFLLGYTAKTFIQKNFLTN